MTVFQVLTLMVSFGVLVIHAVRQKKEMIRFICPFAVAIIEADHSC
ncbi:putative holin-like toxin [Sporolactobacillus sp. CQH2019]|nr:putative holin-like toxin [Sporolactobacillus sp. CQH2019]MDD9147799.1 putative holin-like toxin [Sporolactobacillus sp. CQH2019]